MPVKGAIILSTIHSMTLSIDAYVSALHEQFKRSSMIMHEYASPYKVHIHAGGCRNSLILGRQHIHL